jgi:aerobic-type carbon monoxide dehydrogenase small subunit (CoxS/CutS family)
MKIEFTVNGQNVRLDVPPRKRLLDVLREDLELTGAKEGCGKGECGSCTVLLNGARVNSCLVPALQLDGSHVTTVESVREWPVFERIERAFVENGSVQCGLCIPGYVMSTVAVLDETGPAASRDDLRWALAGNLCRCTGYDKVLRAIEELAAEDDLRRRITEMLDRDR